ncbi:hypothetical protein HK405_000071 [Cladochytrium tenue]|nr:hypothetical protein HK405_000071 [Cladochytrium tenue]
MHTACAAGALRRLPRLAAAAVRATPIGRRVCVPFRPPVAAYASAPAPTTVLSRWSSSQGDLSDILQLPSESDQSSKDVLFPGATSGSRYTEKLEFLCPHPPISTYRVLDLDGKVIVPSEDPKIDKDEMIKMYECMVTLNALDVVLYEAQRQGRISFYITNHGEEATHLGASAALRMDDVIFGQYREAGILLYRGFTLSQFADQCVGNMRDLGKGRQMPIHYGSRALNFQTISSPLGTQIPQAAGAAYALAQEGKDACVACFFGDGAASEGDFHAALNLAATLSAPVIFFCRNNGYAISTPAKQQYKGDGIASRGHGYGIDAIRVDGNDVLAVYNVMKAARKVAITEKRPILIEAMTYRVSHHSTSDDSSAYRPRSEVADWTRRDSPLTRFRKYLEAGGHWSEDSERDLRTKARRAVLDALGSAERAPLPPIDDLFTDVYDELTPELRRQRDEMRELVNRFPDRFDVAKHAPTQ